MLQRLNDWKNGLSWGDKAFYFGLISMAHLLLCVIVAVFVTRSVLFGLLLGIFGALYMVAGVVVFVVRAVEEADVPRVSTGD